MTAKPLVTRDLLPLGSAPAMDLLFALDDRFQTGTVDPAEIAPVARLLGADTIWLTGDAAFERFRTARPDLVADVFADGVPGTGQTTTFGAAVPNVAPDTDGRRAVALRSPGRPAGGTRQPGADHRRRADRAGQGRRRARRRQWRRPHRRRRCRADRRLRAAALHRVADRRRPDRRGDGRHPDHRHRLQPRPCSRVARLAGRHRIHRGRRYDHARPAAARPRRPAPAGVRRHGRTADGRRAGGPGRRPGQRLRRAVRLPPGGPGGDGDRRRSDDGVARRRSLGSDRRAATARRVRADRPPHVHAAGRRGRVSPHRRHHDRHPGPGAATRRARSGLARRRPARRHRADHRSEHHHDHR